VFYFFNSIYLAAGAISDLAAPSPVPSPAIDRRPMPIGSAVPHVVL
jgi:hypothetical protein